MIEIVNDNSTYIPDLNTENRKLDAVEVFKEAIKYSKVGVGADGSPVINGHKFVEVLKFYGYKNAFSQEML